MHDWWFGNQQGGYVSMGVITDKSPYGVDTGICFSYPCEVVNGEWKIIEGLSINGYSREMIKKNETELLKERKMALGY